MANIDKTVKSKYPPKQKNVNWIDTSGDKPEMKTFFNGKWSNVSGSGAGSTNPTEADATKVWQVTPVQKGTKTEETVIVPEQTLENEQELEYNDKFVPGAQCIAVINGVEYRGEVVENKGEYFFAAEFGSFGYAPSIESFVFYSDGPNEVTAKLSIIEEVPDYDYNWTSGVKIPIPTAEDEGKILVVTKVEGDNTSIIVPEQSIPANNETPLTGVDLTKFVVGNTVKVTITPEENNDDGNDDTPVPGHLPDYSGPVEESEQGGSSGTTLPAIPKPVTPLTSQTLTLTGVIGEREGVVGVLFIINNNIFAIWQTDNSLYTDASNVSGPNSTIKLEYIESNYEYQLQENSGGSGTTSGIPSISKNNQPNIVWREPTEEDLAKLPQDSYYQVADLPEKGNLPLFLAYLDEDDGKMYFEVLYSVRRSLEGGFEVAYNEMTNEIRYKMDDEWSILAAQ